MNTLDQVSLLDIVLSKGNVVEPHYHQNAAELVYCISGAAVVSILNPFTNKLHHYPIAPGTVANVPQGWWHYETASADHTHLLAVFNAPVPEVVFGSDILRLTPPELMAHTYCLDETKWKEAVAPLTQTVIIGPPADCPAGKAKEPIPAAVQNMMSFFDKHRYPEPLPPAPPTQYSFPYGAPTYPQPHFPQWYRRSQQ